MPQRTNTMLANTRISNWISGILIGLTVALFAYAIFASWRCETHRRPQNETFHAQCGSNPVYDPSRWTSSRNVQSSHNCYAYALDDLDDSLEHRCDDLLNRKKESSCVSLRPKPGYYSDTRMPYEERLTCSGLLQGILRDNPSIKMSSRQAKCPPCHYKIAYAVSPKKTYHFYREDKRAGHSDGPRIRRWSHKDAGGVPTRLDASNKIIRDPQDADRNYSHAQFTEFCHYLCVPENNYKNTHMKP